VHVVEGEGFRVLVGSWSGGMVSLGNLPPVEAPVPATVLPASETVAEALPGALPFPSLVEEVADGEVVDERAQLTEQVLEQVRRARGRLGGLVLALGVGLAMAVAPDTALAAPSSLVDLAGLFGASEGSEWIESALFALAVLTLLALAPAMLITLTSFTRLIIVFAFLRQAMGTQNTPPNQVLIGLSLFLTFFIMAPTFEQVKELALDPYMAEEIELDEAIERGAGPLRDFMFRQTRMQDLELMVGYYAGPRPESREQVPMVTLVPAFMISELRTAFEIGFLLYVPFLIIDLIISTILLAMGMMVLPPIIISLPFKILLFLLIDGWALLVGSLVSGFR